LLNSRLWEFGALWKFNARLVFSSLASGGYQLQHQLLMLKNFIPIRNLEKETAERLRSAAVS
jgi:hypothetical protein